MHAKRTGLSISPGFGKTTQEKILKGIEFIKQHKGEFLFGDVYREAEQIKERLTEGRRRRPC